MRSSVALASEAIDKRAGEKAGANARLKDNHLFAGYFNADTGLYDRKALRRHHWIEEYFTIKPKAAGLRRMKLNPAQRKQHALVEKMIRMGLPVRVIVCKARQLGFSTDIQGIMFEDILRGQNKRGLIVADNKDRAEMLLKIATTALRKMPKNGDTDTWDFQMDSRATYSLTWGDPINGSIDITSALTSGAGRGGTLDSCHCSEVAYWDNAETQAVGILESLPDMPGTMGFIESTANGDTGWFREMFWKSWEERDRPLNDRTSPWVSLFFAWWENDEYRWTNTFGAGREIPPAMVTAIHKTLDEEEEWLLKQRHFVRRVGWKTVDYDQLAWRRKKIADYSGKGGTNLFNQEYPCLVADTRVSTELGIIPIGAAATAKRTESGRIDEWIPQPEQAVFLLRTKRGRILRATANHRISTKRGFLRLADIRPGDIVELRAPRFAERPSGVKWQTLPGTETTAHITANWARFLGIFMGDGSWYKGTIEISCDAKDEDVVREVERLCRCLIGEPGRKIVQRVKGRKGCIVVRVSREASKEVFVRLGLIESRSEDRLRRRVCVPPCIWASTRQYVAEFLRGLFETDGCATQNKVRFASSKEDFVRDIQLLLLGFGINSTISFQAKPSGNGTPYMTWSLELGVEASAIFHKAIGFIGKRKRALATVLRRCGRRPLPNTLDDEVASIEADGVEPTFDLAIEGAAVFSANGILVHNSRPEVAFLSSGGKVFDPEKIQKRLRLVRQPVWVGSLEEPFGATTPGPVFGDAAFEDQIGVDQWQSGS